MHPSDEVKCPEGYYMWYADRTCVLFFELQKLGNYSLKEAFFGEDAKALIEKVEESGRR